MFETFIDKNVVPQGTANMAAPEKFAPRYGGYCAYGVANGYAVSVDPAAWSIVDGKLYLNYSLSVRESWNKDIPGFIRKAEGNWPRVLER